MSLFEEGIIVEQTQHKDDWHISATRRNCRICAGCWHLFWTLKMFVNMDISWYQNSTLQLHNHLTTLGHIVTPSQELFEIFGYLACWLHQTAPGFHPKKTTYCWWTKSCTTKDDEYPIIYRVLTIPGGAGFCPSTVSQTAQEITTTSTQPKQVTIHLD